MVIGIMNTLENASRVANILDIIIDPLPPEARHGTLTHAHTTLSRALDTHHSRSAAAPLAPPDPTAAPSLVVPLRREERRRRSSSARDSPHCRRRWWMGPEEGEAPGSIGSAQIQRYPHVDFSSRTDMEKYPHGTRVTRASTGSPPTHPLTSLSLSRSILRRQRTSPGRPPGAAEGEKGRERSQHLCVSGRGRREGRARCSPHPSPPGPRQRFPRALSRLPRPPRPRPRRGSLLPDS